MHQRPRAEARVLWQTHIWARAAAQDGVWWQGADPGVVWRFDVGLCGETGCGGWSTEPSPMGPSGVEPTRECAPLPPRLRLQFVIGAGPGRPRRPLAGPGMNSAVCGTRHPCISRTLPRANAQGIAAVIMALARSISWRILARPRVAWLMRRSPSGDSGHRSICLDHRSTDRSALRSQKKTNRLFR